MTEWIGEKMGRCNRAWRCADLPGIVIRHCGHPTTLRPYYAEFDGVGLTKRDLCRSMAAVGAKHGHHWPNDEDAFQEAAPQLLAVSRLAVMKDIAQHWFEANISPLNSTA